MIAIKGIRITEIHLDYFKETGQHKIRGGYELLSNTNMVLAKQNINGYNEVQVQFTPQTEALKLQLLAAIKKETEIALGLVEKEGLS